MNLKYEEMEVAEEFARITKEMQAQLIVIGFSVVLVGVALT